MGRLDGEGVDKWKKAAKDSQQSYCDRLGDRDYDAFTSEDHRYLKVKIAFSLLGSPSSSHDNENEVNIENSYNADQRKSIENLYNVLVENTSSEIHVALYSS